jgi:hypothetical protein
MTDRILPHRILSLKMDWDSVGKILGGTGLLPVDPKGLPEDPLLLLPVEGKELLLGGGLT